MALLHGTQAPEKILPGFTSPTVSGGAPTIDADTIFAAGGNDLVRGWLGDDRVFLGAGNDRYLWLPGDGNDDFVNGGGGIDTLDFRGTAGQEAFELLNGGDGKARLGGLVSSDGISLTGVERVVFHMLGDSDFVGIGPLGGTDIDEVVIDLAGSFRGNTGDGMLDAIEIDGNAGANQIKVIEVGHAVQVLGLGAKTLIRHFDTGPQGDTLKIKGFGGNDRIDASGIATLALAMTLDGGDGDDTLIGGARGDHLDGGIGKDTIIGGKGADILTGNGDNDRLIGGKGGDHFVFDTGYTNNIDTVVDFTVGVDKLALSAGVYAFNGDTVTEDQFVIGAAAADGNDHLIYNADTGALLYDIDGDGTAYATIQIARLSKHLALSYTDFVVLI